MVFITVQNLVAIVLVVLNFHNTKFRIFCVFGLKTPVHAPFLAVSG